MKQGCERQTDIELANLRRQHQLIFNSVGEGVYGLDIQGNVTFVNPAAASLIGWEMQDLIGKSMHAILHHSKPDGSFYPREECHIYAAFKEGTIRRVDNEVFWRKDGSCFPVEYISTPMHDEKGELVGSVVTFRDITQRKLSESILQRANEELEQKVVERTSELLPSQYKIRQTQRRQNEPNRSFEEQAFRCRQVAKIVLPTSATVYSPSVESNSIVTPRQ